VLKDKTKHGTVLFIRGTSYVEKIDDTQQCKAKHEKGVITVFPAACVIGKCLQGLRTQLTE
jgi:hypothetical protein